MLLHPEVATRSCADCKKWEYYNDGPKQGQRVKRKNRDEFVERRSRLPCETPGLTCPKGHHSDPIELSDENWLAWDHFQKASAVGYREHEQNDPIVRSNAAILTRVNDAVREYREAERLNRLARLMLGARS